MRKWDGRMGMVSGYNEATDPGSINWRWETCQTPLLQRETGLSVAVGRCCGWMDGHRILSLIPCSMAVVVASAKERRRWGDTPFCVSRYDVFLKVSGRGEKRQDEMFILCYHILLLPPSSLGCGSNHHMHACLTGRSVRVWMSVSGR